MSRTGKSIETENRLVVARGWGTGNGEQLLMGTGFPLGMMKMFWNYIEVMVIQHCEGANCRGIKHFKMVTMLCNFYHNF